MTLLVSLPYSLPPGGFRPFISSFQIHAPSMPQAERCPGRSGPVPDCPGLLQGSTTSAGLLGKEAVAPRPPRMRASLSSNHVIKHQKNRSTSPVAPQVSMLYVGLEEKPRLGGWDAVEGWARAIHSPASSLACLSRLVTGPGQKFLTGTAWTRAPTPP